MIQRRKKLLAGIAGLALLAATGCSSESAEKKPATTQKPAANEKCTEDLKGGTITMGTGQATQTLDPVTQNSGGNGGTERAAIYDTLMRYDPETTSTPRTWPSPWSATTTPPSGPWCCATGSPSPTVTP